MGRHSAGKPDEPSVRPEATRQPWQPVSPRNQQPMPACRRCGAAFAVHVDDKCPQTEAAADRVTAQQWGTSMQGTSWQSVPWAPPLSEPTPISETLGSKPSLPSPAADEGRVASSRDMPGEVTAPFDPARRGLDVPAPPAGGGPTDQPPSRQAVLVAWLAFAVSAATFLAIPMIFLPAGLVVLAVIGAVFAGLFKDKAAEQFVRWRRVSAKAVRYLIALLILVVLTALIAGTHIVPGPIILVPLLICLFLLVRVFYIGFGGLVILPITALIWLVSEISRIVLTRWVWLAKILAVVLLRTTSASGRLFGSRAAAVGRSGEEALPVVVSKISQVADRWAESAHLDIHIHEGHAHPHHQHHNGDTLQTNSYAGLPPMDDSHTD
jgi:hypothetical protein